jgi:hypothetical protein
MNKNTRGSKASLDVNPITLYMSWALAIFFISLLVIWLNLVVRLLPFVGIVEQIYVSLADSTKR